MSRPMLHAADSRWEPFPLEPSQILEGEPHAKVQWLHVNSAGEPTYYAGLWQVSTCRFQWNFDVHESAHILAGRVRVTDLASGTDSEYGPGAIVFFAKGSQTVWHVLEPLTKFFVDSAA